MEIKTIVDFIAEIKKEVFSNHVFDDLTPDGKMATVHSVFIHIAKESRIEDMKREKMYPVRDGATAYTFAKDEPATEKQKTYMSDLGISFKENVTKREAKDLIEAKRNAK